MKVIPKISFSSIKKGTQQAAAKGLEFIKNAPKNIQTLTQDTISLARKSPKKAAVVAGVAVAGAAAIVGLVSLIKSGVQKVADRKYN